MHRFPSPIRRDELISVERFQCPDELEIDRLAQRRGDVLGCDAVTRCPRALPFVYDRAEYRANRGPGQVDSLVPRGEGALPPQLQDCPATLPAGLHEVVAVLARVVYVDQAVIGQVIEVVACHVGALAPIDIEEPGTTERVQVQEAPLHRLGVVGVDDALEDLRQA